MNKKMNGKIKILIVEHEPNDIELIQYELKKGGIIYLSEIVQNEEEYDNALKNFIPDIILSDYALPSFNGLAAFEIKEKISPLTPLIFVSGTIGEENSIELIKNGVTDFVLKDKMFSLPLKVKRALEEAEAKQQKIETDEKLKQSENRFRSLIENAPDGISLLGVDGKIVYASPATQHIMGITPEEAIGIDPKDYTHPDDLGPFLTLLNDLLQKPGGSFTTQYRFRHKDGSWRWLESTVSNLLSKSWVKAIVFNYRDITERKLAEEERFQLSSILEATSDFVCITDVDQRIVFLNTAGRKAMGYGEMEDLSQKKIVDFSPDWANEIIGKEGIPAALKAGKWIGETAFLTRGGVEIPVSQVIVAHSNSNGELPVSYTH